jgi:solute carrier family 25 citrate transporter 1
MSSQNQSNQNNDSQKQSPPPPKKKSPIQHLIAGGTAGFVESSVCHPLDTIKTRMQLRRQNTRRSTVVKKVEGRALGSIRDAEGNSGSKSATNSAAATTGGGGEKGNVALEGKGALHRSSYQKNETVRVTPNKKPTGVSIGSGSSSGAMHDVGWKQRLPPTTSAATSSATSTVIKSSSSTAAATGNSPTVVATLGPFGTARRIIQREGPLALYKGLTAVYTGIVPKMAIRFVSFEYYRDVLGGWYSSFNSGSGGSMVAATAGGGGGAATTTTAHPPQVTFLAGLLSGLTEAILVVTPAEVCKIRMQSQYHSLMDPTQKTHMKYKNVVQTAALVVKEEGLGALYKGVVPTMLRQGCNQAVNFTAYNWSKKKVLAWKKERAAAEGRTTGDVTLDHWQSLLLGGLSGGMGPMVNNPLDVVKTRMQKQVIREGTEPKYKSLMQSCVVIAKEEGTLALWKGITPRLMRIMPGQAITFMTYEAVSKQMERYAIFD